MFLFLPAFVSDLANNDAFVLELTNNSATACDICSENLAKAKNSNETRNQKKTMT